MDLEIKLKNIKETIKDYQNDNNLLCDKARILSKIAEKINNNKYNKEALNILNLVIAKDDKRSLFLAERANIYLTMGFLKEAKADIDFISSFCFKEHDKLEQLYVSKIVRKVVEKVA